MDTPLLALTRRAKSPSGPSPEGAAVENMRQLAQLRWLAVGGQLLTIVAVHTGLSVPLPLVPMLAVIGLLALANLGIAFGATRHRVTNVGLMLTLLLDIAALTAQLYLSGGATNPFISLYLLQVVLGAILLEVWSAWVLVAVTTMCFAGLTMRAVPLVFPTWLATERASLYTLGALIGFALTATLLALFITRITSNLHARDRYLADLRQHAAEEDGIVRMGLFASGAAHELGTPLASLSVILNDWAHMPALARDAELSEEISEMQAEVERCKKIVTDVLHSAGEPRVEAMGSTEVSAFLRDVIDAWRPTHPGVPLDHRCTGLEGAAVVSNASLRQAIWSVLDNAAEASPGGIALAATRAGQDIVVAVTDRGPGFTPQQLGSVGKPYQSSKGAGHGLGLFLAANVARRLGGRLEVGNIARGGGAPSGAEVKLVLPLALDQSQGGA